MGKYNKAIGATVGALFAWLAAWGYGDTLFGLTPGMVETIAVALGGPLGALFAPKNAE